MIENALRDPVWDELIANGGHKKLRYHVKLRSPNPKDVTYFLVPPAPQKDCCLFGEMERIQNEILLGMAIPKHLLDSSKHSTAPSHSPL